MIICCIFVHDFIGPNLFAAGDWLWRLCFRCHFTTCCARSEYNNEITKLKLFDKMLISRARHHDITLFGLQAMDLSHKANHELLYQKVFEANIHDI